MGKKHASQYANFGWLLKVIKNMLKFLVKLEHILPKTSACFFIIL